MSRNPLTALDGMTIRQREQVSPPAYVITIDERPESQFVISVLASSHEVNERYYDWLERVNDYLINGPQWPPPEHTDR